MLDPKIGPVPEAAAHRGRGHLPDHRNLSGLHLSEFGQGVRRRKVQRSYPHPAGRKERREHDHHTPAFGDQIPPVERPGADYEARQNQRYAERWRDRAEDYADGERYSPEVQTNRRTQVEAEAPGAAGRPGLRPLQTV